MWALAIFRHSNLNFNIFWGFQKDEYFLGGGGGGGWGMMNCGYLYGVIKKLDYFWELLLNILELFLKVKIQNWKYFGGLLAFNYFWVYA